MLERPIDRLDVFRTGNYIAWFRGRVVVPAYHFEFLAEKYIEPFREKIIAISRQKHVDVRMTSNDFAGNRVYRVVGEDLRWVVENGPRPPRIAAEILLLEMKKNENAVNAEAFSEMRVILKRDLGLETQKA
jgi:hypothetical protein